MIIRNPPAWFRLLQVGIGALSIILSMLAIAYPGLAAISVIVLISVILLIIGIERVVIGMLSYSRPYSNEQSVTSSLFSAFFYWEKVFPIYKYRTWYNSHRTGNCSAGLSTYCHRSAGSFNIFRLDV